MPTLTIEYQTEAERLILERAIAYASGIRRLAVTAPRRYRDCPRAITRSAAGPSTRRARGPADAAPVQEGREVRD